MSRKFILNIDDGIDPSFAVKLLQDMLIMNNGGMLHARHTTARTRLGAGVWYTIKHTVNVSKTKTGTESLHFSRIIKETEVSNVVCD